MIEKLIKCILFSLAINWCISAQIYQQSRINISRSEKTMAVAISLIMAAVAAAIVVVW